MSATFFDPSTDKVIKIIKNANNVIHDQVAQNQFVYVIVHNKADPTKFRIVSDPYFNDVDENGARIPGKMEGVELTFADPQAFKRLFPEFAALPPVHLPPNTKQNQDTGKPEGVPFDEVATGEIKSIEMSDRLPNPCLKIEVADPNQGVGAVWIAWKFSDVTKSGYTFSIGLSDDGNKFSIPQHLKNIKVDYDPVKQFEIYNLSPEPNKKVTTKYILVQVINDPQSSYKIISALDVIATSRLTKSTGVT
jgi:hypothetical protein